MADRRLGQVFLDARLSLLVICTYIIFIYLAAAQGPSAVPVSSTSQLCEYLSNTLIITAFRGISLV